MKLLTAAQLDSFVKEKAAAIVQFDAEWDVSYGPVMRRKMKDAESQFADRVNFGGIDCDKSWDLARSIPVFSVPLVAYYREGRLVAALVGHRQNVRLRIKRLLRGEPTGRKDGADIE